MKFTGERLIVNRRSEKNLNHLRHMAAYTFAECFVKDKSILDIGSGSGYGSYDLMIHGAQRVTGVDIAMEAIEYAKQEYILNGLDFKVIDSTKLDFCDDTFDVITSFQVIEHIEDTDKFLLEIKRALKIGGIALISTPNKRLSSPNTIKPQNLFHVREFYLGSFGKLLRTHFEEVEIVGVDRSPRLREFEDSFNSSIRRNIGELLNTLHLSSLSKMVSKQLKDRVFGHSNEHIDGSDFKITKSNMDHVLDFIGVCKKT